MCGSDFVQLFNYGAYCSQSVDNRLLAWQAFFCSPYTGIDSNPNPKYIMFTGMMTPGRNGQGGRTFCTFTGGQHG